MSRLNPLAQVEGYATELRQGFSALLRALLVIAHLLAVERNGNAAEAVSALAILEDDLVDQGYLS